MQDASELDRLLSLVRYDPRLNVVEGLHPFRALLSKDADGSVLRFLQRTLQSREGEGRRGLAFVVAEHYLLTGDGEGIRGLYAEGDAIVQRDVLNALWGDSRAYPELGPIIVRLVVEGAEHPAPEVRAEACNVFKNQAAYGVDVSRALASLPPLLADSSPEVRSSAVHAVGSVAKRKYELSPFLPLLPPRVRDETIYVRDGAAWALWQLSKAKHDIGVAVPALVELLADPADWNSPRQHAAGALLHHARKSTANARQVKLHARQIALDQQRSEVRRFLEQLAALP